MKKIDKELSKRFKSLSLASVLALTSLLGGCAKKSNEPKTTSIVESTDNTSFGTSEIEGTNGSANLYKSESEMVDNTRSLIKVLFKDMNDEVVNNASVIINLDELAKEDENGKVKADVISNFKNKIDSNNMITDFNTLIDAYENYMISKRRVASMDELVPNNNDKKILSLLEKITGEIIEGKNVDSNFEKLYTLFVEEDSITIDGYKFEIRDLTYASRALASSYARVGAYYSRDYITEEKYSKMDKRTNDQNSKAYIMTKLEVLSNLMDEKSDIDVNTTFNDKYEGYNELLNNKAKLTPEDVKNLINYINLEYLNSDKVATKDKREILGGYDNSKITNTLTAIDAINKYNFENQDKLIVFSNLLIDEYAKTSTGTIDELAMNFVEYNTLMARKTIKSDASFEEIFNNPYFQNIYKYILKQEVTYKYKDENNKDKEYTIVYQEISDSVQLINNETIRYTLTKLPKVKYMEDYIKQSESNVEESIQYIQNVVTGECEKVNFEDLNKTLDETSKDETSKVKQK